MKDNGISFVVIGKNEGWKITNCMKSIFHTISLNQIVDYEILYIDSKSTDDSVTRVEQFDAAKIYGITGKTNAAIARNIGAFEAKKEILFFIDGDMEINPETLSLIYTPENGLIYDFVSGDFIDIFYSKTGSLVNAEKRHNLTQDTYQKTTGGLFLITKELWNRVGGMRSRFRIGEDLDLGLRLTKLGHKLYRSKEVLAKHHTISYNSSDRLWSDVKNGNFLYYKSLLYRSHIFNSFMYQYLAREVTLFFFVLLLVISIYFNNPIYLGLYFLIVLVKMIYKRKKIKGSFLALYARYIVFDLGTLIGFFLFWPKSNNNLDYLRLKSNPIIS